MELQRQLKYNTVLQHVLFWLAYILYQSADNGWQDKDVVAFQLDPGLITRVPICMLVTYVNLYLLIPFFYEPQKYFIYALGVISLLLFAGILQRYCAYAIWVPWDKIHDKAHFSLEKTNFWIPLRFLKDAIKNIPIMVITMLIKLMRNAFENEKNLREVQEEKYTAELSLLKAQINPHFFFNTLNSLYGLTLKGSEKASKVVLHLSDLMSYMLYEASADKVLLQDEISHLENYIKIEQLRFADRLDVSFQYSGEMDGILITPLLLLPFVENAFKHSLIDGSGWITINLKVVGRQLYFKVDNSYQLPVAPLKGGLGLKNVKRRLSLTYPSLHELSLNPNNGIYEADLKLSL